MLAAAAVLRVLLLLPLAAAFGWNLLPLGLLLDKDATIRGLYGWVVCWWIGFRSIGRVLSCCMPATYGQTLWHADGVSRRAALTIDDCPGDDPRWFAQLLDLLKRHNVKATLFVISDRAVDLWPDRSPALRELLIRAVAEGHVRGPHRHSIVLRCCVYATPLCFTPLDDSCCKNPQELGNHMPADRSYSGATAAEFSAALRQTKAVIEEVCAAR